MADSMLWNESMLWTVAWQTSLMLAFGLLASQIWSHRPARAHRILILTIISCLTVPALTLAVRELDWGLLARPVNEQSTTFLPVEHVDATTSTAIAPAAVEFRANAQNAAPQSAIAGERSSLEPASVVGEVREKEAREARLSPMVCLTWAWAILSGVVALRLVRLLHRARVFVTGRQPAEASLLRQALNQAASRLGLQTSPELCVSSVGCPVVWCWGRRPVVFVGRDTAEKLASRDWAAVFCHELAHWMRGDHLAAAVSEFLLVLLPWNPLAWWAKRRLGQLAERACDDWVLDCGHVATAYADSLVTLSERRSFSPGIAIVRGRARLEERIRRILRTRFSPPEVGRSWTAVAFGGIITLTTVIALAQTSSEAPEAASSLEPMAPAPFLGPIDVVASHDGRTLFAACADGKGIAVVDVAAGKVSKSLAMPAQPTGLVLSPDGTTLYVTCASPEGRVCSVDVVSGKLVQTFPVGHGAVGPAISPDGKTLYVCNRFNNNVAVVDLKSREIALIPTLREPLAAAVTPDGRLVYVINHLPIDRGDEYDVAAEITVIDTATNRTETIRLPNGSTAVRGICISPDGKYVYVTHLLSRYQMPTTQLERGWMNTNSLTIIDARQKKRINTVLLDDIDLGAANPWGVACTADGKTICVTQAGTHEVSVIDAAAMMGELLIMPATKEEAQKMGREPGRNGVSSLTASEVPNDLAFLEGRRRRVRLYDREPWRLPEREPTVNGPRGLALVGSKVFVAAYFTDNLPVVDLKSKQDKAGSSMALGPKPKINTQRLGEMLFNDATLCFQHWQSCASCHPDARTCALNWDLMNDGLGNPKNARSMILAHKTLPCMSVGDIADAEAAVRNQISHQLFTPPHREDAAAIDAYLKSLRPVPSPYLMRGELSPAAQRGKKLFFDAKINCAKCHPAPLYTDLKQHDIGSRGKYDRRDEFDTPTLVECWRTAPYLHDGHYLTVKRLLTDGKHGSPNGELDNLSPQQIDDLVEFVLSI